MTALGDVLRAGDRIWVAGSANEPTGLLQALVSNAPETLDGPPSEMVVVNARAKRDTVVAQLDSPAIVVAADTIVVLGDRAFGKPATEGDALSMLAALSGRSHRVITGVALSADDDFHAVITHGRYEHAVNVRVGVRTSCVNENRSVGATNGILRTQIESDRADLRTVADVG